MVSPPLHHLSHQRQSKTVCGTLAHRDPEPRRRRINFDRSDTHKPKPTKGPTPQTIRAPLPLMFFDSVPSAVAHLNGG